MCHLLVLITCFASFDGNENVKSVSNLEQSETFSSFPFASTCKHTKFANQQISLVWPWTRRTRWKIRPRDMNLTAPNSEQEIMISKNGNGRTMSMQLSQPVLPSNVPPRLTSSFWKSVRRRQSIANNAKENKNHLVPSPSILWTKLTGEPRRQHHLLKDPLKYFGSPLMERSLLSQQLHWKIDKSILEL